MISLDKVSKSYTTGPPVVRDLSLDIDSGEFLALVGESGCGKTTTLKMINRLVEPSSGTITIDGRDSASWDPVELRRSIGYVCQGIGLFPHKTVAENISVVPKLLDWPANTISSRIDELLALVNLPPEQFRQRWPSDLSGGQQQRVGIARALAAKSQIVLLDEAFGALDPITRASLQTEYRQLHQRLSLTTVLVTHDMLEALRLADRIAVMYQGTIVQLSPPAQLLSAPEHDYVEKLMQTPRDQFAELGYLTQYAAGPANRPT